MMTQTPRSRKMRCFYVFTLKFSLVSMICLLAFSCVLYVISATTGSTGRNLLDDSESPEAVEQEVHASIREAVQIALSTMATFSGKNLTLPPALDVDGRKLQAFLHCSIRNRILPAQTQVLEPLNSTTPRSQNMCVKSPKMTRIIHKWNVPELCGHLLTKRILLVGSQTMYNLHDKLLDILPSGASGSQFSCPGASLCTWHEICSESVDPPNISPVIRYKPAPRELINSAILRFALAVTLRPRPFATPVPYVSSLTGVREYDSHDWPEKARRSDILILGKGPVPAPAWAYSNTSDTSFMVRLPLPGSSTWAWALPLFEVRWGGWYGSVFGAAWKATVIKWLPELMETLIFLRKSTVSGRDKLVIWLGSSFLEQGCLWLEGGVKGGADELRLRQLLRSVHMDDRCVFQNAQVYMQHQLLKEILPHFNIFYIPVATPASFQMKFHNLPSRVMQLQESPSLQGARPLPDHSSVKTPEAQEDQIFLGGLVAILRWHKEISVDKL